MKSNMHANIKRISHLSMAAGVIFGISGCDPSPTPDICLTAINRISAQRPLPPTVPTPPTPQKSTVIIILDGSGSMADPVSQTSTTKKIDDAKEVIKKTVFNLPLDSVNLGLIALGHQSNGCENNVSTIVMPGADRGKIISSIDSGITPRGQTPLAESIRHAEKLLKNIEGNSTIILVSDGMETCRGNPVQEIQNLKSKGFDFVFHAIGYGTTISDTNKLKELAAAGNGKLFNPTSQKQLQDDLNMSINGFGQISIKKPESSNLESWKLFDNKKAIMQISRTTKSNDLLWQPQTVEIGSYNLCILYKDKDKEEAFATTVNIKKDTKIVIDPENLHNK